MGFYEKVAEIERLREVGRPSAQDVEQLKELIGNERLSNLFFEEVRAGWLEPLRDAGVFGNPPGATDAGGSAVSFPWWPQGVYLKRIAAEKPKEVLEIASKVKSDNPGVLRACIESLVEMPPEVGAEGIGFVMEALMASESLVDIHWHWIGNNAASVMVKIAEGYPDKAFQIAKELLRVWRPNADEGKAIAREVAARMEEYWYREFVVQKYSKLWKRYPWRGCKAPIEILDGYCEQSGKDDYSVRSGFVHKVKEVGNADANSIYANDIIGTLVWGIVEAGKAVIEEEDDRIGEMLDYLEERDKPIFWRIVMHLLRAAGKGIEADRVNRIIRERRFLQEPYYECEYKLLLNDRFHEINGDERKVFEDWVDELGTDSEELKRWRGREVTNGDVKRANARMKAEALYLVRDRYRGEFEDYIRGAGMKEEDAAPRPWMSEVRCVDPKEGAEYSEEDWMRTAPAEVIRICSERRPEDWKEPDKDGWNWRKLGIDVQAEVLKRVVQRRVKDYLAVDANRIVQLPASFLGTFMLGIWEGLGAVKHEAEWERVCGLIERLVSKHGNNKEYQTALSYACSVLRVAFDDDGLREKVVRQNVMRVWEMVWGCAQYKHEEGRITVDGQRDFVTECINTVVGKAFQLAVRLGVICKNKDTEQKTSEYKDALSERLRECLELMLESDRLEVLCVFGMWFPQLCYLEEDWVMSNIDRMFDEEKEERWEAVWGTYMGWSRISKVGFELLKEAGKYCAAIDKAGQCEEKRSGRNTVDEGLAQHLMIAYFNGWMEYDDVLLSEFFDKAGAGLRGYAAWFLTTGFKVTKENQESGKGEREATADRMRRYWNGRLEAAKNNPQESVEEVKGFTVWVKDTLLPVDETLELLEQTLRLTKGEVGERGHGVHAVIEGLCEIEGGHELEVLKCLNLVRQDKGFWMSYHMGKEQLERFLGRVVELEGEGSEVEEVRGEAIEFADELGRMGIMDYRNIYEQLRGKLD